MSIITKPYMTARSLWSHNPIPGGCVLYLPLWNPGCWGSTFKSIDSYGHVCTRTGGVMSGDGWTADGDDYIKHAEADWRSADSSGTIIVWFKTSNAAILTLFSSAAEISDVRYVEIYLNSDGYPRIQQNNNDSVDLVGFSTSYNDGNWHQIACISSGTAYSCVVDGVSKALTVLSGANNGDWFADTDNRTNFVVGAKYDNVPGTFFTGTIGEVWVYERLLSDGEMRHIYNSTKGRFA